MSDRNDLSFVAEILKLPQWKVDAVVKLLDSGNTVPFVTRYRKDQTGGLDEEQIRKIENRVTQLRLLAERKETILRSIDAQGKLTPELSAAIGDADSTRRLEDLYLPYKPKKQTLATLARQRGLELFAKEILGAADECADLSARAADYANPDRDVPTGADALLGAGHILAEQFSERADLRGRLRGIFEKTGSVISSRGDPDTEKPDSKKRKQEDQFRDYYDYREPLAKVPPHRVLAINRGEKAKALRVKIEADAQALDKSACERLVPDDHPHKEFLVGCARDALGRLVLPSLEREMRRHLTESAERHAVGVFARNLRNLFLQSPARNKRVLAIDPGFRSGCKMAALDPFGNPLDHGIFHIVGNKERCEAGKARLIELIDKHQLSVIAIGNGTACRQTEELIAELLAGELKERDLAYVIVNESGASVYSASPLAREELPDYDATARGTISIGRRLLDPLSELVKIDPGSIGVGLYQHDVRASHLRDSLEAVVESCVNYVGVDLNTASPALLRRVSGLNQLTARRLFDHRQKNGPFTNREQLKEVSGFGEATFTQAAGFLKITGGDSPLDATWIHPESYEVVGRLVKKFDDSLEDLTDGNAASKWTERAKEINAEEMAKELGLGELTLKDILADLARPGRDPRDDLPPPMFKRGVLKLEDLTEGMELSGTVLNVVDFGAFVDVGLSDTGLVHVSQLADKFIQSPHDVVAVGDIVKIWVLAIDAKRRRVSLTMIDPSLKRAPRPPRRQRKPAAGKSADGKTADSVSKGKSQARRAGGKPFKARGTGGKRPPRKTAGYEGSAPHRRKKKPVVVKLTSDEAEGKTALRSFGALKQFLDIKEKPPEEDSPK